jgi:uncharacterized protein YdeI (BOF family)
MKSAILWTIIVLLFLVVALPQALAQNQKPATPKYDVANEVTIKGTVDDIKTVGPENSKDTHLMVKTDKGVVEVCLCPAKFLSDMDMNFAKGDKLEITGARAKQAPDDTEVILAREIVRGETTMVLRDKTGGPVWTWLVK